jgi:hypothetical protein
MPVAEETEQVAPGIFIWQFYDPKVRADLFSTAVEAEAGMFLVDPIPLKADAWRNLEAQRQIAGLIITNENHARATPEFADKLAVPIYLHGALRGTIAVSGTVEVHDREIFSPGLTAIAIDGAPAGEIAVHYEANGGALVVGDGLINFEPYGFALLPAKYCSDSKLMRRSLSKLLDYSFDRMLFAHGTPILSGARQRLETLLAENR